ncbi:MULTISPECIES: RICIN domain-containing protein [unclassified Microcoleus]|uniref:RICIN domain-containing protein n=1 Tax=unclassified Microcoleus TaxID=2642155 RepID=UPI002FD0636D
MDIIKFFQGGIFKIVALHSDKVIDVPSSTASQDGAQLQQWEWGDVINQKFRVFPVDDVGRYFVIASLASGQVMDVTQNKDTEGAVVQVFPFTGKDNQLFELDASTNQTDTYFIRSKYTGRVLNVSGVISDNGTPILQHTANLSILSSESFQHKNIRFKFEKVEDSNDNNKNILNILEQVPVSLISEFPELSSPQKPQVTGEWRMVGKPFLIPYFMVKDNNSLWQIHESPYYLLTREVCYTLNEDYFTYNNTASEQEYEVTVIAGFTTEEAASFSKSTGLEISGTIEHKVGTSASVDGAFVAVEVSAETSVSFTASASHTFGYSTSTSLSRHSETAIRRLVKCPKYTSLAVWNQTSKFTLMRLNKTILKSWEIPEGGIFIDDIAIPHIPQ